MASPLGRLFGKSPIAPIQRHMQLAQESVQMLCELLTALADGELQRADDIQALMIRTVAEARDLRHDLRKHLPRGLLLAMPRADLLQLVEIQQDIVTRCMSLTLPLAGRGLTITPALRTRLDALCSALADAADRALAAIRELDEMLELAFMQNERGPVHKALDALREQLAQCEEQHRRLLGELNEQEATLPAVDVMLLHQAGAALAGLALRCSDVGDQLDLLLAR
jgi:predicted phosphate transport protein (TIGR00153 family)